jgi:hypothetical protein
VKRIILVLTVALLMLTMTVTTALPALGQPSQPYCDWYEAGFDVGRNAPEWWGYWCHYQGYGWYLIGWWSDDTGFISVW